MLHYQKSGKKYKLSKILSQVKFNNFFLKVKRGVAWPPTKLDDLTTPNLAHPSHLVLGD